MRENKKQKNKKAIGQQTPGIERHIPKLENAAGKSHFIHKLYLKPEHDGTSQHKNGSLDFLSSMPANKGNRHPEQIQIGKERLYGYHVYATVPE